MRDISMHILDIIGNSVRAGASLVKIAIVEDRVRDLLILKVEDDGCGMDAQMAKMALDPFFTSRKTRKVGLGIPLLKQNTQLTGGDLVIESEPGKGTQLKASFVYSHIDRPPLGDLGGTIGMVVSGNPKVDFIYTHQCDQEVFKFDSRDVKKILDGVPVSDVGISNFMQEMIRENLIVMGVK
ncbi:ATP-binding protein [Saccharicrinis fermentans]|uniref:histidine kinase n=1 Tax=Saccharicrinis fermentans DSM 9555 = JCM 21142 TaxID=869213 RepID=W7XXI2_9BACT|nr:ATP-binding protein [Saccharicrinis fermentans]GAF03145.1 alginate biosynthesis sensor protein KinB [Saccharicrinis fermentans DSM 9555 = JCM 21142]